MLMTYQLAGELSGSAYGRESHGSCSTALMRQTATKGGIVRIVNQAPDAHR